MSVTHRRCPSLRHHSHQDPFDDYKVRLAKKLAKKAEAQNSAGNQQTTAVKKAGDGMNWFGVKLGTESAHGPAGEGSGTGGVGKYLSLKRPAQTVVAVEEHPKKRKLGFGDFENF
jgi:peptidyl-prolyl cis-trans isomerase-like 2